MECYTFNLLGRNPVFYAIECLRPSAELCANRRFQAVYGQIREAEIRLDTIREIAKNPALDTTADFADGAAECP